MLPDTAIDSASIPALWSVNECAVFLGKSPRWVQSALKRRATDKGSIPHIRIGRTPRFVPDDILEWARLGCPPAETLADWKKPS